MEQLSPACSKTLCEGCPQQRKTLREWVLQKAGICTLAEMHNENIGGITVNIRAGLQNANLCCPKEKHLSAI